ncbi:Hypothetical predicted protein, partial [Paramuricea clavata]
VALDNIIDSTSNIINSALDLTRRSLIGAWESGEHGGDFLETVTKSFDNMLDPFASMRTNYLQTYIKRNFNYVGIKEVVLGKTISRKFLKNMHPLEKDENFVHIPLIESLDQLLSNKRIAKLIRKPWQCDSDIYYGQIFLTDKFLADHPDALQIIIPHLLEKMSMTIVSSLCSTEEGIRPVLHIAFLSGAGYVCKGSITMDFLFKTVFVSYAHIFGYPNGVRFDKELTEYIFQYSIAHDKDEGWSACSVHRDGKKAVAQKALRKKIQKHTKSQAHIAASGFLDEKEEEKVETALLKSVAHSRELTERLPSDSIFCWAPSIHRLPRHSRSSKQKWNRVGSILHSRYTCMEMLYRCQHETSHNAGRVWI